MKIATKSRFQENETVRDVIEYVEHKLDGCDHGMGVTESTEVTADNIREAFGKLVDKMASRGLLAARDICDIVDDNVQNARFTDE